MVRLFFLGMAAVLVVVGAASAKVPAVSPDAVLAQQARFIEASIEGRVGSVIVRP